MNAPFPNAPAPARLGTDSTYDGLYLRSNLRSTGSIPAAPPFDQCPDIIQSNVQITDPQTALSTAASWATLYDTAPGMGRNYYYVRGCNGAPVEFDGKVSLYWAPAQLILFPSTWKNNPLRTASGREQVSISAAPGKIGVGSDPFLLDYPGPVVPGPDSFYSFVAQNTATPIPEISSWLEMSQLVTQQLSFGFRNMVTFDPVEGPVLFRLGLDIPASVGQSATVQLVLTATGMGGDTVALLADCFTPEMKEIALLPTQINGDSFFTGIKVDLDPGFSASLAVQYWNTSRSVPAPGATITLSANYVIPDEQIEQALQLNVLDSGYSLGAALPGVGPQPVRVAPLGAVSFVVGPSGG